MKFLFDCSILYLMTDHSKRVSAVNKWDMDLNKRREIPYLQATVRITFNQCLEKVYLKINICAIMFNFQSSYIVLSFATLAICYKCAGKINPFLPKGLPIEE